MKSYGIEVQGDVTVVTLTFQGGAQLPAGAVAGDHFFLLKAGTTTGEGDLYVYKGGQWRKYVDDSIAITRNMLGRTLVIVP